MSAFSKKQSLSLAALAVVIVAVVIGVLMHGSKADSAANDGKNGDKAAVKPALAVTTTELTSSEWPLKLNANGNIAAWQEASVGAEVGGLRLTEVNVNVGDVVRRGQVLAEFSAVTVKADRAQAEASVKEAEAMLNEARLAADRARALKGSGAMSEQQTDQVLRAEQSAEARLASAQATLLTQKTRLQQTQVLAPDAGIISARIATVGAVVPAGQELFRLIRDSRLEWRAEVPAADLPRLRIGQKVTVVAPGEITTKGRVRMLAPTVDSQTRMALVYVDLPTDASGIKAGMFARGEFELGRSGALTLPQGAVVQREGFSYVYRVGADNRAIEQKVTVGRRLGDRIEITGGLDRKARVVATGSPFLTDGDLLRVVDKTAVDGAKSESDKTASAKSK